MNRLRQIKVEKDNENNDIKRGGHRGSKTPLSARGMYPKVEVCNARLNRMKRVLSNEYGVPIMHAPAMTSINGCGGKHKGRNGASRPSGLTPRAANMLHHHPTVAPMSAALHQRMMTQPAAYHRAQHMNTGQSMTRRNIMGPGPDATAAVAAAAAAAAAAVANKSGKMAADGGVPTMPLDVNGKRRRMKVASAFLMPDQDNKSFVYLCKPVKRVKELLTAREIVGSSDNFRPVSSTATLCRERNQADEYVSAKSLENSTTDEFELAPLMSMSSTSSSIAELSSARVFMNVRELLNRRQHELLPEQLDTIKDVVKTDARHHQLNKDGELFKDILRTQLQEIRKQETLVETALSALEEPSSVADNSHEKVDDNGDEEKTLQPIDEKVDEEEQKQQEQVRDKLNQTESDCLALMVPNDELMLPEPKQMHVQVKRTHSAESFSSVINIDELNALAKRKIEIDLVLKNIPNLQHEIKMLHAIGEKLESTMRLSIDERTPTNSGCIERQSSTIYYTPCEDTAQLLQKLEFPSAFAGRCCAKIGLCWSLAPTRMAQTVGRICGVRHCYGYIKEFRIEQKTLTELKNAGNDNQWFYIPVNEDRTELKRTSFKRLKDNPDMFMQYLKPRSPLTPSFNLLEQDPMFLSGVMCKNNDKRAGELSSSEHVLLCEGDGDNVRNRRTPLAKTKWLSVGAAVTRQSKLNGDEASQYAACAKERVEHCFLAPCCCQCQRQPMSADATTLPIDANAIQKRFMQQLLKEVLPMELTSSGFISGSMIDASTAKNPSLHKLGKESLEAILTPLAAAPAPPPPASLVGLDEAKMMMTSVNRANTTERLSGGKNQQQKKQQQQQAQEETQNERTPTSTKLMAPPSSISSMTPTPTHMPRRIKRSSTPLSRDHTQVEPKSHLLKTVIVGIVQISVFLLLIMAITYPDVHC